ncbi:AraC family transcriptional regulator [Erwinia sorbitola]|uniref:AraC family transcriptional regulator n=1 Tax=Erwinia sorbitola TaxID=2681984 RepID=A0A6I6EMX0_9GAMM|nr:AraC family transcriptional regulator [Erwinia sorbitola]MTD25780.1 AraC family transcriptional regulator [Erwinia sorbitola]QGU87666.1 AraC family transcriptional regulator [Erwinia sorbitola]
MYLRQPEQKAQQVRKTSDCFCKSKNKTQDAIPASWDLNDLQRNFIESMFEDKKVK